MAAGKLVWAGVALALVGIVALADDVTREGIVNNDKYFILDQRNKSLTLDGGAAHYRVHLKDWENGRNQMWKFMISGDKRDGHNNWVIRPEGYTETMSLDADKSQDKWYISLFNWSNSRLWAVTEKEDGWFQIKNNRYDLCLRSNSATDDVDLGACAGPEASTLWYLLPHVPGTLNEDISDASTIPPPAQGGAPAVTPASGASGEQEQQEQQKPNSGEVAPPQPTSGQSGEASALPGAEAVKNTLHQAQKVVEKPLQHMFNNIMG